MASGGYSSGDRYSDNYAPRGRGGYDHSRGQPRSDFRGNDNRYAGYNNNNNYNNNSRPPYDNRSGNGSGGPPPPRGGHSDDVGNRNNNYYYETNSRDVESEQKRDRALQRYAELRNTEISNNPPTHPREVEPKTIFGHENSNKYEIDGNNNNNNNNNGSSAQRYTEEDYGGGRGNGYSPDPHRSPDLYRSTPNYGNNNNYNNNNRYYPPQYGPPSRSFDGPRDRDRDRDHDRDRDRYGTYKIAQNVRTDNNGYDRPRWDRHQNGRYGGGGEHQNRYLEEESDIQNSRNGGTFRTDRDGGDNNNSGNNNNNNNYNNNYNNRQTSGENPSSALSRKKEFQADHIVYESELLGEDPTNDDWTDLPSGPTAEEKQKESGFGRFRGRGGGRGGRGFSRGNRGFGRGGRGGSGNGGGGGELWKQDDILKPYKKAISVPDVCVPFVIGRDDFHLKQLAEKLRFDVEFVVTKPQDKDRQGGNPPSILEIFAISEEILRRVENMIHVRITEGLTTRQPGYFYTVIEIESERAQFTRYIGEEFLKSDKSFVMDYWGPPSPLEIPAEPNGLALPKDTRPWKPPPSNRRLQYDVGVCNIGDTMQVALIDHPQACFRLIREQMSANVRSSFKVFARLGKMIFDAKSPYFPRSGQAVRVTDVSKVLIRDLARVRFITTIPYPPISRLYNSYIKPKGYKLTSISRKIAVHYFNGVDRLIATFHVPSPVISAFSSDTVTPGMRYEAPVLSNVKIESHRLLMTNYSRPSDQLDFRLSSISAIAQSSEEHDNIIHIIASAWALKKPSEIDGEMILELPLAYRNLNLHIVRYKTCEKYVCEEDGTTVKLTKHVQDEVSNGQWLSITNFKKFQVQQTATKELDCPVCKNMFRDPCTVPCCGESYCRECMKEKQICPSCNENTSYERLVPNKKLEKLVEQLRKVTLTAAAESGETAALISPPLEKSKWEVTVQLHKWQNALKSGTWDDVGYLKDVPHFMDKVKEVADACGNPFK